MQPPLPPGSAWAGVNGLGFAGRSSLAPQPAAAAAAAAPAPTAPAAGAAPSLAPCSSDALLAGGASWREVDEAWRASGGEEA